MRVFINPGHSPNGIPDPGTLNYDTGLRECDVALGVGQLLKKYLIQAGVPVVGFLQSDSLPGICDEANLSGADIFISLHCNGHANGMAKGAEVWACAGSQRGGTLADCIQKQIVSALNMTDRGVRIATPGVNGLYVLTNTDMPAVLVELGFITNVWDEQKLRTKQDDFARAIARGVTDYQLLVG